ncbi:ribosomal RNA processing protein 1 homolog [Cylas formicarius]|uniref:ribosomal RNA processing protein 1 homolog n=1 Tax=Cylas formicarius TaxID=197179 RepID=UPI00295880DA|nr:ribosomal RNA processing protein 1 homolog [Cylas formicarius]
MAVLAPGMDEKISATNIKKKTLLTAQDLKFARRLAENDPKIRQRALKHLKDYLNVRSQNTAWSSDNLLILWKGLFYSMWMADKPLVQEECAENIAGLIHSFNTFTEGMEFFRTGLVTLQNEWFGIDQHRLDKYLMLVRRVLRQALMVLAKVSFKKKFNLEFSTALEDTVLSTTNRVPIGLFMHFTEIYLEEVAKTSFKKLQKNRFVDLVRPFIIKLAFASDPRETKWISKFILTQLMKQHKLGIEYKEKYEVWRSLGFPGSITQIQKVNVSSTEDDAEEQAPTAEPLDPRAGRVDVELSPINFDPADVAETLTEFVGDQKTSATSRNVLRSFSDNFKELSLGRYPLGAKKAKRIADDQRTDDVDVTKAAKKLMKFERKLLARDRKDRKRAAAPSNDGPVAKKKRKGARSGPDDGDETADGADRKKSYREVRSEKKLRKIERQIIEDMPYLKSLPDDADVEYIFKRNSGVWFVTSEPVGPVPAPGPHVFSKPLPMPNKAAKKEDHESDGSPDYKTTNVDDALTGGREHVLPSPTKTDKKMSRTDRELKRIFDEFEGRSSNGVFSSQPLLLTPKPRLSSTPKKVRINTKMNVSQEIYEHVLRVVSSPQIPYDGAKKPARPVLKPTRKAIPINPFYKLKKSFFDGL